MALMTFTVSTADDTVAASTGDSGFENKVAGLSITDKMAESTSGTTTDKSTSGPRVNKSLKHLCWRKYLDCGDVCNLRRSPSYRMACYAVCFDAFLLC